MAIREPTPRFILDNVRYNRVSPHIDGMALLYPISSSTFGDSRETSGSPALRKYVLAQFTADSDLAWVGRLRAKVLRDELKYRDFQPEQRRIRSSDAELFRAVENGISQATVVVIDPEPTAYLALNHFIE
jgi:hypothetical protein